MEIQFMIPQVVPVVHTQTQRDILSVIFHSNMGLSFRAFAGSPLRGLTDGVSTTDCPSL